MAPETLVDAVLLVTLWATAISVGSRTPVGGARASVRWYALGGALNTLGVPLAAALLAGLLHLPPDVRVGLVHVRWPW
jgi:hypothetical protein